MSRGLLTRGARERIANELRDEILSGRTIFDIFNLQPYVTSGQQQPEKTK